MICKQMRKVIFNVFYDDPYRFDLHKNRLVLVLSFLMSIQYDMGIIIKLLIFWCTQLKTGYLCVISMKLF
jgi:hypothetical protein